MENRVKISPKREPCYIFCFKVTIETPRITPTPPISCCRDGIVPKRKKAQIIAAIGLSVSTDGEKKP